MSVVCLMLKGVALIEASLEELPVSANWGQSCLATMIRAPGLSLFWVVAPQICFHILDTLQLYPSE